MPDYIRVFIDGYSGYASYLWQAITHPGVHNYFYALLAVSIFFFALEWWRPWRADQPKFRKDFWLDAFYMFFNFFLFSLVIYNAASDVVVVFFNNQILQLTGVDLSVVNPMYDWPAWAILLVGFVVRDFVQWWTHRLLHRVEFLWNFHKVHHSVEQMGFAAHLRYHWMETIVYRSIEYIPLALLGIGLYDFFVIHIFTLIVGHYNHSNISVPSRVTGGIFGFMIGWIVAMRWWEVYLVPADISWGTRLLVVMGVTAIGVFLLSPFMKKIFNSPEMHIWHHAYDLPDSHRYGVNFGLTLAVWDYLFNTAYVPYDGRDIRLGFPKVESFPKDFFGQITYGIFKK